MSDSSNNPEQTPVNQASNIPNDDLLKAFDKPQDQYTCINLNNRKIAIAFIDSFLSEYGYFPSLDLSKLKVESRDMHDDVVFKDSRADIRYSIPLVNAPDETSQVVVLAEHKSSRDPWAILQLEHYTSLALYQSSPKYKKRVKTKVEDSEKKNKKKGTRRRLPPVIPIIIYNGKKPYSGPRCLSELYQHVNGMKEPYLEFKPIIIDLRKIPFDELPNNPNEWRLNAVLRALKSGMMEDLDFKEVEKNFQNILEHYNSENPEDVRFLKETIRYYLDGSSVVSDK